MKHTVYLALGTNLGDRRANLRAALRALPPPVRVLDRSAVYETPPWGLTDQPSFLNQVVRVETDLEPEALLAYLKGIERKLGRRKTARYGPRTIDLDILFYDDRVIETTDLVIPHPRLEERAFVLVPLADLTRELRHPVHGRTVEEMLQAVDTEGIERIPAGEG